MIKINGDLTVTIDFHISQETGLLHYGNSRVLLHILKQINTTKFHVYDVLSDMSLEKFHRDVMIVVVDVTLAEIKDFCNELVKVIQRDLHAKRNWSVDRIDAFKYDFINWYTDVYEIYENPFEKYAQYMED